MISKEDKKKVKRKISEITAHALSEIDSLVESGIDEDHDGALAVFSSHLVSELIGQIEERLKTKNTALPNIFKRQMSMLLSSDAEVREMLLELSGKCEIPEIKNEAQASKYLSEKLSKEFWMFIQAVPLKFRSPPAIIHALEYLLAEVLAITTKDLKSKEIEDVLRKFSDNAIDLTKVLKREKPIEVESVAVH